MYYVRVLVHSLYQHFKRVYIGTDRSAQREKCKYLVHLCMAASLIKARKGYNYHPGSCATHFSVMKEGNKQGDDMGHGTSKYQKL